MPPMMLSGTTIRNATVASLSELTNEVPSRSETGTRYWYEVPRSPRRKLVIQSTYCVMNGLSTPAS